MFRFDAYKHLMSSICFAILLIFSMGIHSEAQAAPYEALRNEVARMASQIPPEDRYAVVVLDPVVDREELQDCLGSRLSEAIIQVLYEFGFTLIERDLFFEEQISQELKIKHFAVSKIAERIGATSIFAGTVNIEHEAIRVTYRMTRMETSEIIGILSGSLSKKELTDCFLKNDLAPPTLGIYPFITEPRRIR